MIDSLYYIFDIFCLIYLFHWAAKVDDKRDEGNE